MIEKTISFGIFMLIENLIILTLLGDLIRRVATKVYFIRHPHIYWTGGVIFLAYLICVFIGNASETYTGLMAYVFGDKPIETMTVAARVFNRSMFLCAKSLLWYYTVNHGFEIFSRKSNHSDDLGDSKGYKL